METAMKICQICKEDCSTKARVRDPEGKYYCKSCLDERTAQAAPAAAGASAAVAAGSAGAEDEAVDFGLGAGGGADLADLLGASEPVIVQDSSMCPECGHAIRAGAALCVHCGYNPAKGKAIRTAVKAPERDQEESEYAAKRARAASAAAMTPVRMVVVTVVAGIACAVVWTLMVYTLHREFKFVALAVGAVVGVAAIKGARGDGGPVVALTAAAVALCAIMGGRYGGLSMWLDDEVALVKRQVAETDLVMLYLADDVATEWEDAGREVDWPYGQRPDFLEFSWDFPEDVWAEAQARWAMMTSTQQRNYTYQVEDRRNDELDMVVGAVKDEAFIATIDPRFIALMFFGTVAAFSMGMWGDDLPI